MPVAVEAEASRWGSKLTALLGVATLAAVVSVGVMARRSLQPAASRAALPDVAVAKPAPEPRAEAKPKPSPASAQEPENAESVESEFERNYRLDQEQRAQEQAERERTGHEAEQADQQRYALESARRNVSVVMYSTSWCGACKSARAYLSERGTYVIEHDIEASEGARATMWLLNPSGSVPTLDIDGEVLVGFDPTGIDAAIERVARRRVGI